MAPPGQQVATSTAVGLREVCKFSRHLTMHLAAMVLHPTFLEAGHAQGMAAAFQVLHQEQAVAAPVVRKTAALARLVEMAQQAL